jgi:DNA-binding transcriptional LysR family regulator
LNWDDVRLFLSIAEEGSFRKAAIKLGVGHSTLSRRIDSLEQDLGVKLFNRLTQGLRLTSAGEEMLETAIPMNQQFNQLHLRMHGQDQVLSGRITLTISEMFLSQFLLEPIHEFMTKWPDIVIEVNTSIAVLDLASKEADVAIRITNTPPEHLIGRQVGPYCEAAYASKDYIEAFLLSPSEHKFASPGDGYEFTGVLFEPYRAPLKTSLIMPNMFAQFQVAVDGMAIASLPCVLGDQSEKLVRLCDPFQRAQIWILAHKDSRENKRMQVFRDFLAEHFRKNQSLLRGELAG